MSDNTNPPSGNSTQIIVALLAIAAAIVAALGSAATNNPQFIIPLLVLIGVGAVGIVLFAGVMDHVSDRLSNGIARIILRRIEGPGRSKFRSSYLKYLYYSHRTFDVEGL